MNERIVLILALLLLPIIVSAQGSQNWLGYIEIQMNNTQFEANEEINGNIILTNLENFPINDGTIILHITQGDYVNPSHFATSENIVYQTKLTNIWALPNSSKLINFSLPNPGSGKYRVDAYAEVGKSEIFGQNGKLLAPFSKSFSVSGEEISRLIIDREKTYFGDYIFGQNELFLEKNEEFSGKIFIKNESNIEKKEIFLIVSICKWDYSYCVNTESKTINVGTVQANSEKEIEVPLVAPNTSSIYEINFRLMKKDFVESIYKSRIIVKGSGALLKKIFVNEIENDNYSITTMITGNSLDNSSFLNNSNLKIELHNNSSIIEEKIESVSKVDYNEIILKEVNVSSKDFDKVCVYLENQSEVYDKECFQIYLEELKEAYKEIYPDVVKISWDYSEMKENLSISLTKDIINSKILVMSGEEILFEELVLKKENSYSTNINLPKTTALLIVDDLDSKRQQVINLILDEKIDLRVIGENTVDNQKSICTQNLCDSNQVCSSKGYDSVDGICCEDACIPAYSYNSSLTIPLISVVSIIVLIIAIFVVKSTTKRVKK